MTVLITDRASARFAEIAAGKSGMPRIEIQAGGCNGFEKKFSWTAAPEPDDIVIPTPSCSVVFDPVSFDMLSNAIVDYKTDLQGSYFVIDIPEAASTCGCGTSFSL
jgi:iron-sulfur cluster insertion protein